MVFNHYWAIDIVKSLFIFFDKFKNKSKYVYLSHMNGSNIGQVYFSIFPPKTTFFRTLIIYEGWQIFLFFIYILLIIYDYFQDIIIIGFFWS